MSHTPSGFIVNRGVNANDGTGDTLRDAFGKLNDAVEQLYEQDLSNLGNVDTTGVVDGNTLVYNASTGKWEASGTVAASQLNDLTDVTISSPLLAGHLLRYSGATWANTALSTTDVTEGTNLYFTTIRSNDAFDARLAVKTTTNLAEGTNLYYTDSRADARVTAGLAATNTDSISEGSTNLYYTDARADARAQLKIDALVAGAPAALDTLNELAAAIADDASYAATVTTALAGKEPTITATTTADYYRGDKTFVTLNTDAVPESGSPTNLWYTTTRHNTDFDTRLATKSTADLAEDPAATVSTGTMYYTDARANTAFDTRIATKSTADLSEDPAATVSSGTMYYTDARVATRIGSANIGDLNNVNTAGVANDTFLRYNGTASEWQPATLSQNVVVVGTETFSGNGILVAFSFSTIAPTTESALVSINGIVQTPTDAYSISGSTLTFTAAPPAGTDNIEVRALGGGEQRFLLKSADFNAAATGRYGVDTSGGVVTATLPGSPATGDAIFFMDSGGAYSSNTFTVDRNGNTINGAASNLAKTTDGESFGLMYNGSTWRTY